MTDPLPPLYLWNAEKLFKAKSDLRVCIYSMDRYLMFYVESEPIREHDVWVEYDF